MMARVRGVMAAAIFAGSMLYVDRLDVDKDRLRPEARDGAGGGEEGVGCGDDLVARADAPGHQGQQQRIGARGAADGVRHPAILRDFGLKPGDFRTHDEALAFHDRQDHRLDLASQSAILGLEIQGGYANRLSRVAHNGDHSFDACFERFSIHGDIGRERYPLKQTPSRPTGMPRSFRGSGPWPDRARVAIMPTVGSEPLGKRSKECRSNTLRRTGNADSGAGPAGCAAAWH